VLEFMNIKDDDYALLILGFLNAAFVPGFPIPSLVVHGAAESGKSTLLKVVKKLIDPAKSSVRRAVRSPRDFAIMASHNRLLILDNLTSVKTWLSDTICGAVTGEGFSTRTLRTDEDETIFEYRIIVGLGGINLVATKPDLLRRSLIISLDAVAQERYLDDTEFWVSFNEAYPYILGALFDTLSKAMKVEPGLKFRVRRGMADFARWGAAATVAMGRDANSFLAAYYRNIGRQNQAAIDASLIALVVIAFMEDKSEWAGPPYCLLKELTSIAETMQIDTCFKDWPKNPSWLSKRLKEVEHNLLEVGIQIAESRTRQQRIITLRRIDTGTDASETSDL